MKIADVRAMTPDQLDDEVLKLKKEQFNLRFQRATGQLENTSRVRQVRRDIARLKTVARQKEAREHQPHPGRSAQKRPPKTHPHEKKRKNPHITRRIKTKKDKAVKDAEASVAGRRCQRQAGQDRCRAASTAASRTRP